MNDKKINVETIKKRYPVGTRIELISMEDPCCPVPPGTQGEVAGIDALGTLHMSWDNGRTLGIVPYEDSFKVLSRPEEEMVNQEQELNQGMGGMSL